MDATGGAGCSYGYQPVRHLSFPCHIMHSAHTLVWRSRPEREARGSGDSRIMYLYNLTENWCVQSNRSIFN